MPELVVVDVPGPSVRLQHVMTLLVGHHLIVGLIQSDPHLHVGPQFSVTQPGVVCERLRGLSGNKIRYG